MSMRLFIAAHIPDHCRISMQAIREELAPSLQSVRWVRSEGIHLTLKFLGDVEERLADEIRMALDECFYDVQSLGLVIRGLGVFPNPRAPRVIWTGFESIPEPLSRLQKEVERSMERLGFPLERRPFKPHLTLGRFRSRLGRDEAISLKRALDRRRDQEVGRFNADRYVLFESTLMPGGARYRALQSWPETAGEQGDPL